MSDGAGAELDLGEVLGLLGPFPYAPPPPAEPRFGTVVPIPRSGEALHPMVVDGTSVAVGGVDAPGPRRLLEDDLARNGVSLARGPGAYPVELRLAPVGHVEGYRLEATPTGMVLEAEGTIGLSRAAATARQLVRSAPAGLEVATGTIEDCPTVPLRVLAGWGLYRAERAEAVLEVAAEGKFNRVLYNWWAPGPHDVLGPPEERFVRSAREIGVEPVLELRRQALGPTFSMADPTAVEGLLAKYDAAVDRGFRSFGLLFDDTDHDSFEDELALLDRVVDRLEARLGEAPELFFCPRFYWFPGQMDYSWLAALTGGHGGGAEPSALAAMLGTMTPRSPAAARARQVEYLEQLARRLRPGTEVYIAHWWSSVPEDAAAQLAARWTAHVGRAPVFWDNQLQNDFRAGAVHPMASHQRSADFAGALRGYALNSAVPLAANAASSITAGAWAWNPEGYDAATAAGAAIARVFGPGAGPARLALAELGALLGELSAPRLGMENHHAGLRAAVAGGRRRELEGRLDRVQEKLAETDLAVCPRLPLARAALTTLRQEVDRLRLDLELAGLAERVAATEDVDEVVAAADEARRLAAEIRAILVTRLPAAPGLAELAAGVGPAGGATVAGSSWVMHFVDMPLASGAGPLVTEIEAAATRLAAEATRRPV